MWSWTSLGVRRAVEAAQQARAVVVVDQRGRLRVVDLQAAADRLLLVVLALDQPRAVLVADALVLGGVELHVVDVAGVLHAHPPPGEPAHELRRRAPRSAAPPCSRRLEALERLLQRVAPAPRCGGSRPAGTRRGRPRRRSRSVIMPMITSSGTSSPAFMYAVPPRPSSVPSATCARSMSPVEMCGRTKSACRRSAWVPLPAPGGPSRIRFSSDTSHADYPLPANADSSDPQGRARYFRKPS